MRTSWVFRHRQAEQVHRADDQPYRRLDQRPAAGGIAELRRQQDRPHQRLDLVVVAERRCEPLDLGGIGPERHELAPQLLDDRLGGARMAQQDGDDLLAIEAAGLAEEGLLAVVMLVVAALELAGLAVDRPASERGRRP
jgi:hypothetical protein